MDAKDVLKLLKISRSTLTNYVNNGTIRVTKKHNGFYNYNDSDVYKIAYGDKSSSYLTLAGMTEKYEGCSVCFSTVSTSMIFTFSSFSAILNSPFLN